MIGDFSSDTQIAPTRDVANLVKSWSPDAVVTVGDNNYPDGGADTIDANIGQWYQQFISPYSGKYGTGSADGVNHFWPAVGNHDWTPTGTVKPYTDYFTLPNNERYYDVQIGNVGVFVIDSDSHEPDGTSATSTDDLFTEPEWSFQSLDLVLGDRFGGRRGIVRGGSSYGVGRGRRRDHRRVVTRGAITWAPPMGLVWPVSRRTRLR